MKLEVLRSEPPGGRVGGRPPLLFVHGAYCGAWIWAERFMPWFSRRGYSCVALSLRGHGDSGGEVSWASLSDYVDDLDSVAATLDSPPVLLGHSMGGLVVQHYLGRGKPVSGAVLLSSVPPSGLGCSITHMSMMVPDLLWQLGLLQSLGPAAVSQQAIVRGFFSSATAAGEMAHLLTKLQRESHRITSELMCPAQPKPPATPGEPPVLVMGGDHDAFLPVRAFEETATFFRADLQVLKGAPHGLMLDSRWWEPAADHVAQWLTEKGL